MQDGVGVYRRKRDGLIHREHEVLGGGRLAPAKI